MSCPFAPDWHPPFPALYWHIFSLPLLLPLIVGELNRPPFSIKLLHTTIHNNSDGADGGVSVHSQPSDFSPCPGSTLLIILYNWCCLLLFLSLALPLFVGAVVLSFLVSSFLALFSCPTRLWVYPGDGLEP